MKCLEAAREMSSNEFKKYMITLGLIAGVAALFSIRDDGIKPVTLHTTETQERKLL